MWVYLSREQAEKKNMIIPDESLSHGYFIGHFASDGILYCCSSAEKKSNAMRMVNYLNGGTGEGYPGMI
jgi:hypothetical protein